MEMTMDDLRRAAFGCFTMAPDNIRHVVGEIFKAMDLDDDGCVRFPEYSEYMELVGCPNLSSEEFFNELKQGENDGLYFDDILTLLYVVHTKRPFCQGNCKRFVKGIYFTCLKCFDFDQDDKGVGPTFSICSQCFSDQTFKHHHDHKQFMDPIVLLIHYKKLEPLSKSSFNRQTCTFMDAGGSKTTASSSSGAKSDGGTSLGRKDRKGRNRSSTSKNDKIQTWIQFGQLAANLGGMMVVSQLCTIM